MKLLQAELALLLALVLVQANQDQPQLLNRRQARRILPARLVPIQLLDPSASTQDPTDGTSDFTDSSSDFTDGTSDFTDSSSDFTDGTSDFTDSSSDFTDSSSMDPNPSSSPSNTPKCPFGYLPAASDISNCHQLSCVVSRDCTIIFGPNSTCDQDSNTCTCDSRHKLDPVTQRCTGLKTLGHPCHDLYDCMDVPNSVCIDGTCQCRGGFKPTIDGQCGQSFCSIDSQCVASMGANSQCSGFRCQCKDSYKLDEDTQMCVADKKQLDEICNFDDECGKNAVCGNDMCKCTLASRPESDNINCKPATCDSNFDCSSEFPHTKCSNSFTNQCQCDYDAGYQLDTATQKCKAKSKSLGDFCSYSSECGLSAYCVNNFCQCHANYKAKSNNQFDCEPRSCLFTSECEAYDSNSVCFGSNCACATGAYVDYDSQTCTRFYDDDYYDGTAATALSIMGVTTVVGVILVIVSAIIRNSRRARAGRVVSGGQRATAVVTASAKVSLPQKS